MHKHAPEIKIVFQRSGRSDLLLQLPIPFSLVFPFSGKMLQPEGCCVCTTSVSVSTCHGNPSPTGICADFRCHRVKSGDSFKTLRLISIQYSSFLCPVVDLIRFTIAEQLGKHHYLRKPKNGLFSLLISCVPNTSQL